MKFPSPFGIRYTSGFRFGGKTSNEEASQQDSGDPAFGWVSARVGSGNSYVSGSYSPTLGSGGSWGNEKTGTGGSGTETQDRDTTQSLKWYNAALKTLKSGADEVASGVESVVNFGSNLVEEYVPAVKSVKSLWDTFTASSSDAEEVYEQVTKYVQTYYPASGSSGTTVISTSTPTSEESQNYNTWLILGLAVAAGLLLKEKLS